MENTLKLIIESLVENKEAISIKKEEKDHNIKFEVSVASEEMGKVIGKRGKIAQAVKTLIRSIGSKENKVVEVVFVDPE